MRNEKTIPIHKRSSLPQPVTVKSMDEHIIDWCNHAGAESTTITIEEMAMTQSGIDLIERQQEVLACDACNATYDDVLGTWRTP